MAQDEIERPQWFTIREAADYLQVGEPTIYRWMRDGRITYRKVGDSTRFLEEDLAGVIQVHPSKTDLDQVREACPLCGHDELVLGRLQSTGAIYFRPQKAKFWTMRDANVKTEALMCCHCGGITWLGDVEKLSMICEADKEDEIAPDGD